MDQERLSSLEMCTIQHETANKVINNDTELQSTDQQICGKTWNTHFFWSDAHAYTHYSVSHTASAV